MGGLIEIIGNSASVDEMPDGIRKILDTRLKLAVVGRYSSGKSSLINYLLNMDLLPTDTQKVTAIPTYIFKSDEELVILEASDGFRILGMPIWEKIKFELSHTSSEDNVDYRMYVRNIYLGLRNFPFDEIVIIDTPGYSGSDEDYEATLGVLGMASGVIFLIHIEEPLTDDDLNLIEKFTQPFIIVINKADKKWSDRYTVARHVYETLREEGVRVDYSTQIIPFSISADEDMKALLKVEEMRLRKFIRGLFDTGSDNVPDRLAYFARSGNLPLLRILVDKGADYAFVDEDGRTLLHHAILSKNTEVIEYLLDLGLDVNAEDKEGKTPLHYAVDSESKDVVEYLLKRGANPNSVDNSLMTPLHYASRVGNVEIVRLLLNYGADVNVKNEKGNYPIHYACTHDDLELVKLLLENAEESPVNWINKMGQSPLHIATYHNNTKIIEFLIGLDGVEVNLKDKVKRTPLHYAARNGNLNIVKLLIEHGANISPESITGERPLHEAVYKGHLDVVEFLIDKGAYIDVESHRGYPIHIAVERGNYEMVDLLIRKGAELNLGMYYQSNDRFRAMESLYYNMKYKYWSSFRDTLSELQPLHIYVASMLQPLHIASMKGYFKIAKLLVNSGAEINAKDLNGITPLDYALMFGHEQVAKFLIENGGVSGSPAHFANIELLYDEEIAHEVL